MHIHHLSANGKGRQGRSSSEPASLSDEQRTHVDTATAAHWLNRKPNTLRIWAHSGGPVTPRKVNGRLAWPVSELRRVLGVPQ